MTKKTENFRCPKTAKLFTISNYRVIITGDITYYRDRWMKQIVNPENGEILEFIGESNGLCKTIHGSSEQKYQGMQDHFKRRNKDQAKQTEDIKKKAIDREIGNITGRAK